MRVQKTNNCLDFVVYNLHAEIRNYIIYCMPERRTCFGFLCEHSLYCCVLELDVFASKDDFTVRLELKFTYRLGYVVAEVSIHLQT